mgnify:CR=1 FL=1
MDRRQKKTRAAIFSAFTELLSEEPYDKITIQQIIDRADIGRTTFYDHFETKDALLGTLCEELFGHIINDALCQRHLHGLYGGGEHDVSIFFHVLAHLQENDHNILRLLSGESNELFLRYFKDGMVEVVNRRILPEHGSRAKLPADFLVNHIAGSFIEMVHWWIRGGMQYTPEQMDRYFQAVIGPLLS